MSPPAENEILSSRYLAHPRQRVFEAFSDPQQLTIWFGPKGFTSTFETFDFTPGGEWRFLFHGPNGTDYPNYIRFAEIALLERIVYDHVMPHFRMTMTFTDENEGTRVTWCMAFESIQHCEALRSVCVPANEENFDRLEAHLSAP